MSSGFKAGDDFCLTLLPACVEHPSVQEFESFRRVAEYQQFNQLNSSVIKGSGVVGFFPNVDSDHQRFNLYLRNLLVLCTLHIETPPQFGFVPFKP
jgi:hypothetical protein